MSRADDFLTLQAALVGRKYPSKYFVLLTKFSEGVSPNIIDSTASSINSANTRDKSKPRSKKQALQPMAMVGPQIDWQ